MAGLRADAGRGIVSHAGDCLAPVPIGLHAVVPPDLAPCPAGPDGRPVPVGPVEQGVVLLVRCRSCEACLEWRRRNWCARGIAESEAAASRGDRTWFLTLTFAPERFQGTDDAVQLASRELTRYLDRLRKAVRGRFRYLAVLEFHRSGLPHLHVLLHEDGSPIRWAEVTRHWHSGFIKAKLAQGEAWQSAGYLTKYVTKAKCGMRIRASVRYGKGRISDIGAAAADGGAEFLRQWRRLASPRSEHWGEVSAARLPRLARVPCGPAPKDFTFMVRLGRMFGRKWEQRRPP